MRVRNIVRKAASLAAGSGMVGATLMGAMAYDLANFPEGFIVDGMFDGNIVVGERAATSDVVASIDLAAALQAASTVEVSVPGASGRVELEGEGFELSTGSDRLELRESIGDVVDTVSEYELPGLKSGRITTSEGDTEYFQYLRFKDGGNLQNMTVNFIENDDNEMDTYLVVETDLPFIEWELQFPEGAESERDTTTNELDDLEDKTFNIMGQDFTIVKAEVNAGGGSFEMILMGGSIADTLREGETRTYSIDGVDYEVTLVFVSDPNSGTVECKFSVNGELTQALEDAETDTLSGGLQIGVRDILVNAREGVASFFLGADKIEITDPNTNNSAFDGSVEINNENINDGDIDVQGNTIGSDKYEITDIKYRLTMDPDRASTLYVLPGHGLREFMRRPESLISDTLDVFFAGLEEATVTPVELRSKGDDEYDMIFTNIQGREYRFPLLSNEDNVWKYGDDDDDLVFVESSAITSQNIGDDDYFIVSNDRGTADADKSVTNVLKYEDYDNTDFTLELTDVATDSAVNVPITTDGTGSLVIGGHTYQVNVSNRSANSPTLAVDLNADGDFANDVVKITAWGGVVIDIAFQVQVNDSHNISAGALGSGNGSSLATFVGDGKVLDDNVATDQEINMSATVLAKNFDSSDGGDETINWSVNSDVSEMQADLDLAAAGYTGPLEGDVPGEAGEFQFSEPNDDLDDWQYGMSDWGIFIKEYDPDDSDEPNELFLEVPQHQRFAQVFVTLGSVSTRSGGGSTSTQVNPIAVGLAVLDRDAPAVGMDNLIVVGGPCANTVAAELLGNPENCADGFEPGKGIIRAWDRGDTVAILVAGYEAQETVGATRVLAQWEDYSLSGSELEVVVADLNSITVQAPSAPIFADGFESGDTSAWE